MKDDLTVLWKGSLNINIPDDSFKLMKRIQKQDFRGARNCHKENINFRRFGVGR